MYTYLLDRNSPNQSFTTIVDGIEFDITLQTANDVLFATIKANGKIVKTSGRCVPGSWLIPYPAYAPEGCGNFMFLTRNNEYPNFKNFNTSCILIYASKEEMRDLQ